MGRGWIVQLMYDVPSWASASKVTSVAIKTDKPNARLKSINYVIFRLACLQMLSMGKCVLSLFVIYFILTFFVFFLWFSNFIRSAILINLSIYIRFFYLEKEKKNKEKTGRERERD